MFKFQFITWFINNGLFSFPSKEGEFANSNVKNDICSVALFFATFWTLSHILCVPWYWDSVITSTVAPVGKNLVPFLFVLHQETDANVFMNIIACRARQLSESLILLQFWALSRNLLAASIWILRFWQQGPWQSVNITTAKEFWKLLHTSSLLSLQFFIFSVA